jgi:glycosyltransferase involved in cell wall biosynthesis
MTPAVSVVVATYNYGRFLADALESALAQTFRDLEVVVVDDGSTDETPAVVRPFLADPRVRCVRTDHMGQPGAKNVGIRLARAPLVAFLDADDLWLPAKLERQLPLFEIDRRVGVVYSRRLLIDEEGWPLEYEQPPLYHGQVLEAMFRTNFVCFSSVVVRRRVFEEAGPFDERLALAIDYDQWLRVARHWCFDYVDEPLVRYRVGHANLSRRVEERLTIVLGIMRRFLNEGSGRRLMSPAVVRRALTETYCHMALVCQQRSRWAAVPWMLRALATEPTYGPLWHGLLSWPLPETVRRRLRLAFGRPIAWNVRRRVLSAGGNS